MRRASYLVPSYLIWGGIVFSGLIGQALIDAATAETKEVQDCLEATYRFDKAARQLCDQALKVSGLPDSERAEALMGRGSAASFDKDYPAAITDFDAAIKLNGAYASAYLLRGLAYRDLGKDDEAIADFGKSIELRPELEAGYLDRSELLIKRQDWAGALADLNHVVQLSPKDAGMLFMRGYVHEQLHQPEDATADYTAARALDPQIDTLMRSRGYAAGR